MRNMNFLIPFYIVTFTLIEWANNYVANVIVDVQRTNHNIFAERRCRLLVNESVHDKLSSKKLDHSGNYKLFDGKEGLSPYAKLKEKFSDNYSTYMKALKRKYPKKKGLKKLDCYCEKTIFKEIENFDKIADSMNCSKRNFINIFLKKYSSHLISFFFFITFGSIIPILNNTGYKYTNKTYKTLWKGIGLVAHHFLIYHFLYMILWIIIVFAFIYTFLKIVKYEGIKAGKCKMKPKEYLSFIKETYKNKL